jgi:hypothetical protein
MKYIILLVMPTTEIIALYNGIFNAHDEWKMIDDLAHICMKPDDYDCYNRNDDSFVSSDLGWMLEYKKNCEVSEVKNVLIECDAYCGNYIMGSILQERYPNVQTIIMDRYRGHSDNIYEGDKIQATNFIAYGAQGTDNPFEFCRRLSNVEYFLFSDKTYIYSHIIDTVQFGTEILDCPNLKGLIFLQEMEQWEKIEPVAITPPSGWNVKIIMGQDYYAYHEYWICYERI